MTSGCSLQLELGILVLLLPPLFLQLHFAKAEKQSHVLVVPTVLACQAFFSQDAVALAEDHTQAS